MLVASCSDDNNGLDDEGGISQPSDGKAYVQFSIKLPTVSGTRAGNNVFNDGIASEYAVNKAHLVIFKPANTNQEADATVAEVIELKNFKPWNTTGTSTDQVTSEANIVAEIKTEKLADKPLYALIVLNANEAFMNKFSPRTEGGDAIKFSDLYSNYLTDTVCCMGEIGKGKGFIMMNAPLAFDSLINGETKKMARTLVPIWDISATSAQAATKPALDVYVERGVAKVTLKKGENLNSNNKVSQQLEVEVKEGENMKNVSLKEVEVEIEDWMFDMGNKSSFIMHNVSGFNDWRDLDASKKNESTDPHRFYGKVFGTGGYYNTACRIYWAEDVNYSPNIKRDVNGEFYKATEFPSRNVDYNMEDEVYYPLENTFCVDSMRQNQTSRVVIKGRISGTDGTSTITTTGNYYRVGSGTALYDLPNLKAVITNVCRSVIGDITLNVTFAESLSFTNEAGLHEISIDDFDSNADNYSIISGHINDIKNALGKIDTYLKGECYYKVLIMHFGDDLTKWEPGDPTYGTPANNNDYLGRYGIVRNNWYQLSVNAVKTVGSSTIPDTPDTPDDENKSYINVTCKILSWAVRNQNVEL